MRSWLIALLAVGCASVDRDIEDQITIEQGVYGLLISGCDTSGCREQPASDEKVIVYAPGESSAPHARVLSDDEGVYQIDLASGDYVLCTYSCIAISIPDHDLVRADWTSGPGGGHWTD